MRHVVSGFLRLELLASVSLSAISSSAVAFPPLPALNIDVTQTSVSGISSGGFMSAQFQVAHSSIVKGAGIVAGGPYYCSQDSVFNAVAKCSCTGEPSVSCQVTETSADVPALVSATRKMFQSGRIDSPDNVAKHRVLTVSGAKDTLVPPPIARQLHAFYKSLGMPQENLSAVPLANAAHTMPTQNFGIACNKEVEPYIGKCAYDSAKAILSWIYGPLLSAGSVRPKGRLLQFDQQAYIPADHAYAFQWRTGLDSTGWAYIPDSCARGEACRVHVALHGCKQGQSYMPLTPPPGGGPYNGTIFVKNAGYNRWADKNHLVILYPQAVSIPMLNPNGCWDWWGYTDAEYATKKGIQIRAIRAMVDRLASGAIK